MTPSFTALEWFEIRGRGSAAVVKLRKGTTIREARRLLGDRVTVDNKPYTVRGVETFALPEDCVVRHCSLLVEPAGDGGGS